MCSFVLAIPSLFLKRCPILKMRIPGFFLVLLTFLVASPGGAAVWKQAGSARLSAEYDSNPSVGPIDPEGVWRFIFEPRYQLKRSEELSELDLGAGVEIARASDKEKSHDREDPNAYIDWRRHREAGSTGLSARYYESDTRSTELRNSGPGLAEGTRISGTVSANLQQNLSERSAIAMDAGYEDVAYKRNTAMLGTTFVDYVSRSAGLTMSSAISETSTPYVRVVYTDFEPASSGVVTQNLNTLLGWNWIMSESLSGSVQLGQSQIKGGSKSTLGAATVQYASATNVFMFNAGRQIVPSGRGGFTTSDELKGSWVNNLDERSKRGASLSWGKTHNVFNTLYSAYEDITYSTLETWLQKEFTSRWGSRFFYELRATNGSRTSEAYAHIVGGTLIYTYSNF